MDELLIDRFFNISSSKLSCSVLPLQTAICKWDFCETKKKNRDLLYKQKDDLDSKDYPYTPWNREIILSRLGPIHELDA